MKNQRHLNDEQEQVRLKGLRILARIIARHYLAHPDLYPSVSGERQEGPLLDSRRDDAEDCARGEDVA